MISIPGIATGYARHGSLYVPSEGKRVRASQHLPPREREGHRQECAYPGLLGMGSHAVLGSTGASSGAFDYSSVAGYTADISADFVTQSGTISAFADQSGNSHNFSQGTAGNQPTYEATGWVDGTPSALFDGTDDYIECTTGLANTLGSGTDVAFTVFMVMQIVTTGELNAVYWTLNNSGAANPIHRVQDAGGTARIRCLRRDDAGTSATTTSVDNTINTSPHVFTHLFSGTAATERIDGVQVLTGAADVGAATFNRVQIGTGGAHIRLKRWLAYTGLLSATDYGNIEAALATDHGL